MVILRMVFSLLVILFMLLCQEVAARSSIDFGIGPMQGHTTYSIGGKVKWDDGGIIKSGVIHDPLSKLEFSLDVYLAQVGIKYHFDNGWILSGDYALNLTQDTAKMKDSDWGIDGDPSDTLSIYSESDSELSASIIERHIDADKRQLIRFF